MNLHDYLQPLSAAGKDALAKAAGTKKIYLIQIAGGHEVPSPQLAMRIEKATQGQVSRYDLRPDAAEIWGLRCSADHPEAA